ncbi:MAG: adenosylmethionine decarboxylase [Myxococcota bacterium]|nr:adenosylmethionine decarboxylase [Myxococcota bacterium]OQC42793.1 MAG: S-adenosylmethionine decarboxylase proenzyme precursor [Deltaproteobacteria bacterium ADurb.Bin058]HQL57592.1 adenosylmethionine decarboxylase [Myxococcota bacterium]
MNALGRHLVADFHGCTEDLNDPKLVMDALEKACEVAGATIISRSGHHFSPYGVTAVVVIAESHLAVHTWPEYAYAAVDLFTCGDTVDTWKAFDLVKSAFGATRVDVKDMPRGILSRAEREKAAAAQAA